MGEAQEVQLHIIEAPAPGSPKTASFSLSNPPPPPSKLQRNWRWWLMISLFTFFILAGQSAATLLGRFFYNNGGQSLWMATIVESAGAPLLFPFLLLSSSSPSTNSAAGAAKLAAGAVYISLALLIAGDNLMYSYGLLYLPVSTYSLLCATQLAFNALFSFFLNSQKFTPFIFNSIILLTLAAALLGVRSEGHSASSENYALGFALTIAASATFSLVMSLTQLSFQKVFKGETFAAVIEMTLWTNFLAAAASVAGLFISGEWRGIHSEFVGFQKGRLAYVMALVWTAVSWLLYSVGAVGLIFVVSSLFSNVIATLALPLVPVFAVVFFHDRMDGIKVVALLIAILGFVNYLYQHYVDDAEEKKSGRRGDDL